MQPLETPTQGGATKRQAECPPPSYQAQFRHDPPGMSDQARGVGDSHPARYVWLALSSHVHERDWEGGGHCVHRRTWSFSKSFQFSLYKAKHGITQPMRLRKKKYKAGDCDMIVLGNPKGDLSLA